MLRLSTLAAISTLALTVSMPAAHAQGRRATVIVNAPATAASALKAAAGEHLNNQGYILATDDQVKAAQMFVVGEAPAPVKPDQAEQIWQRVGTDIGVFIEAIATGEDKLAVSLTVFGLQGKPVSRTGTASMPTLKYDVGSMMSTINLNQPPPMGGGRNMASGPVGGGGGGGGGGGMKIGVPPPGFTFDLSFVLAPGGEVEVEDEDGDGGSADLDPTIGAEARALWSVGDYFAIGPLFRFSRLSAEDSDDGGDVLLFDISVAPVGRFRFTETWEGYVTLPIGFELALLDEDEVCRGSRDNGCSVSPGIGYSVALKVGFRAYMSDSFSFFSELGGIWRSVTYNLQISDFDVDEDFTATQDGVFTLNFGIGFGG